MNDHLPISHRNKTTHLLNILATAALWPIETALTRRAREEDCTPCFILGPPRSGTTFLFELMTTRIVASYFSNFAMRLYKVPVAATWLIRNRIGKRVGTFDSDYGKLSGSAAPSESGRIWIYWMPDAAPYHLDIKGLAGWKIRKKLTALGAITGGPVIVKYLFFQGEISRLSRMFPKAVFIHLERDWTSNALSIMKLRETLPPEEREVWASTRPAGWEAFEHADVMTQCCAQVALCHREIRRDLSKNVDPDHVLHLHYEDLCRDPESALHRLVDLLRKTGAEASLKPRNHAQFEVSSGPDKTSSLRLQVSAEIANISRMLDEQSDREGSSSGARESRDGSASPLQKTPR